MPYAPHLAQLKQQNRYRVRKVIEGAGDGMVVHLNGQPCLNFCSNDYLGLAQDRRVVEAARTAVAAGTGASALVSGYQRIHQQLEEAFAAATGQARALVFASGYAANVGAIPALMGKENTVGSDALNHASLIDGLRLSGARVEKYPHLQPCEADWRVSDTLFSMDGDRAPLLSGNTYLDDAHGFGLSDDLHLPATARMIGFGKSLGTAGAVVVGGEEVVETLIQRARTYIFSTAPAPMLMAATLQSLELLQSEPHRRQHLQALIQHFKQGAAQLGLPLLPSDSPIQPVLLGSESAALAASQALLTQGLWVAAIRPPTVPEGTCRLRITLTSLHSRLQVEELLGKLAACGQLMC
jgi:8-amino-7-oxononanoate synthase